MSVEIFKVSDINGIEAKVYEDKITLFHKKSGKREAYFYKERICIKVESNFQNDTDSPEGVSEFYRFKDYDKTVEFLKTYKL